MICRDLRIQIICDANFDFGQHNTSRVHPDNCTASSRLLREKLLKREVKVAAVQAALQKWEQHHII
ncbi:hypothetical protein EON65_18180 [archaeon]|nr:MAG: hypothetical protein EON65_18180 [archaeon]